MRRIMLLSAALVTAFAEGAKAQSPSSATMQVLVQLQSVALRLELWNTFDMGYHTIGAKTITWDPTQHGAHLRIRGDASRAVALTFPSSVILTASKSTSTLEYVPAAAGGQSCDWQTARSTFASGASLTLSTAGEFCAWMGGKVTVADDDPADVYAGQMTMSVTYLQ